MKGPFRESGHAVVSTEVVSGGGRPGGVLLLGLMAVAELEHTH